MEHPFSQTVKAQDAGAARRRSTRIDFVTTVLLSGKDATSTPFREYTQTSIVNLHGCKVRTSYKIIVGMLVNIECPKAGTSGKGVCIRVWEPDPGVAGHEIAIQLIKPQNLWGVPNPPADWELVAKSLVQGRTVQVPAVGAPPTTAATPPRQVPGVMATQQLPAVTPMRQVAGVTSTRQVAAVVPTTDQRVAELERRANQLVESVLDILRGQAEELTRASLEEFRQQIEALIQDSEGRLRQGLTHAYEESAASLMNLRTDLMEQISSRGAQMVRATEDTLRNRLLGQSAADKASKPAEPITKK